MNTAKRIYVVGTCDTKGAELNYAADLIAMPGANCVVVDVSTSSGKFAADVSAAHVDTFQPGGVGSDGRRGVHGGWRGRASGDAAG